MTVSGIPSNQVKTLSTRVILAQPGSPSPSTSQQNYSFTTTPGLRFLVVKKSSGQAPCFSQFGLLQLKVDPETWWCKPAAASDSRFSGFFVQPGKGREMKLIFFGKFTFHVKMKTFLTP